MKAKAVCCCVPALAVLLSCSVALAQADEPGLSGPPDETTKPPAEEAKPPAPTPPAPPASDHDEHAPKPKPAPKLAPKPKPAPELAPMPKPKPRTKTADFSLKDLDGVVKRTEALARPGLRSEYTFPDPESPRVIYGQTAIRRKKGTWDWTIYELGLWNFDYGVTDWLEVGVEAAPPLFALTFFPHVKIGTDLGKNVSVAVRVMGGFVYPYIGDVREHYGLFGGGPILTIGDADLCFNISWPVYVAFEAEHKERFESEDSYEVETYNDYDAVWATWPHIGFSWRVHKRVKLNAELYTFAAEGFDYNGEFWVFVYGIRLMGNRIFGDINFVVPIWEDAWDILQYMPIGYPLLVFGFQW